MVVFPCDFANLYRTLTFPKILLIGIISLLNSRGTKASVLCDIIMLILVMDFYFAVSWAMRFSVAFIPNNTQRLLKCLTFSGI